MLLRLVIIMASLPLAAPARAGWHGRGFVRGVTSEAQAVPLDDGRVLVMGFGAFDRSVSRVFDPRRHALVEPGEKEALVPVRAAVHLDGGRLLALDRYDSGDRNPGPALWDPGTRAWKPIAPLPQAMYVAAAAALPGDQAVALGFPGRHLAVSLWDGRRDAWRAAPDPPLPVVEQRRPLYDRAAFVERGLAVVLAGGRVLALGQRGYPQLQVMVLDPREDPAHWREGDRFRCEGDLALVALPDDRAAVACSERENDRLALAVLDAEGRTRNVQALPGAGWEAPHLLIAGGRLLVLDADRAWWWGGGAEPPQAIEAPFGWTAGAAALPDGGVFALAFVAPGTGQDALGAEWSPADEDPAGACAGLTAFLQTARVPDPAPPLVELAGGGRSSWEERDDVVRELFQRWAPLAARLGTPSCRTEAAAGRAPALLAWLAAHEGQPPMYHPSFFSGERPWFELDAQLGRLGVCALRLPGRAAQMSGWLDDETHPAVRGVCLAALAEDRGAPVAVAAALDRGVHGLWGRSVDESVVLAATLSPALRRQAGALLARARAGHAKGYELLRVAVCQAPGDAAGARPAACAGLPENEEAVWAEGPRGGSADFLAEGRAELPTGARAGNVSLALGARAFRGAGPAIDGDGHLGGTRAGGLVYGAHLLPLGFGSHFGPASLMVAVGGGFGGVSGEVPFAWELPLQAVLDLDLGACTRLTAWARGTWALGAAARDVRAGAFSDDLEAGLRLGFGRTRVGTEAWRREVHGPYVSAAYASLMGSSAVALALGWAFDSSTW